MITILDDQELFRYARCLEAISIGEGGRFLCAYYDKKSGGQLYVKKIKCTSADKAFYVPYRDFIVLVQVEDLITKHTHVFEDFFLAVKGATNKPLQAEATDIRKLEGEVQLGLKNLNATFMRKDISSVYEGLLVILPNKGSILEDKMIKLIAHYRSGHGTMMDFDGLSDLSDLALTTSFDSKNKERYFVIKK